MRNVWKFESDQQKELLTPARPVSILFVQTQGQFVFPTLISCS